MTITNDNIRQLVKDYFKDPNNSKLYEDKDMSEWDVSRVTDMSKLFQNKKKTFQIWIIGMCPT